MRLPLRYILVVSMLAAAMRGAELTIATELRWRQEKLAVPSRAVANDSQQTLRLTRFAALISEVALLRTTGETVRLEGQFGFLDAESGAMAFTMRNVPSGDYAGLEFQIGLPREINHADPGQWSAKHPLNPLVNALHWSWQGGYVFVALEGHWRDAASATERGFTYHLATDARRMRVGFRAAFQVGDDTRIDLALDLARVLSTHKIAADDGSESTHSAEGDELAPRLVHGMERAWFWLRAVPALTRRATEATAADSGEVARRVSGGTVTPYAFVVPNGFPQPSLPADNPLTVEGIALGEALFFDARLSSNATQSCASCHAPTRAFSDGVALSRGAEGALGTRNAMPLFNLAWNPGYAWDGSQPRIRDQAHAAWTNPIEMNAEPEKIVERLSGDSVLAGKFRAAFGASDITVERAMLALEQFLLTRISADSKFDRALRGVAVLSEEEKRGFELFATEFDPARGRRGADCFHCHGGALFTDFTPKNNGLDLVSLDAGRSVVTGNTTDRGKFKTPSLRNVALTGPYMHDGRFATLEEVIAHYDHGVQRAAALDPNLAKHPNAGLGLTSEEQRALVAFLRALTDPQFERQTPASVASLAP